MKYIINDDLKIVQKLNSDDNGFFTSDSYKECEVARENLEKLSNKIWNKIIDLNDYPVNQNNRPSWIYNALTNEVEYYANWSDRYVTKVYKVDAFEAKFV